MITHMRNPVIYSSRGENGEKECQEQVHKNKKNFRESMRIY